MKLQLNEIMEATISELDDIDMTLAFEIEAIERQLSGNHDAGRVWKEKAMKARDHMKAPARWFALALISSTTAKKECCMALFWLKSEKRCLSGNSWMP